MLMADVVVETRGEIDIDAVSDFLLPLLFKHLTDNKINEKPSRPLSEIQQRPQ